MNKDSIIQNVIVTLSNNTTVHIQSTTYKNNTTVVEITEAGKKTAFTYDSPYEDVLKSVISSNTSEYAANNYIYEYINTKTDILHLKKVNTTYAAVFSLVSEFLAEKRLYKAAVATAIVSAIFDASSYSVDADLNVAYSQYGVYNSSHEFLNYYQIELSYNVISLKTGQTVDYGTEVYETLSPL